jgi:hypothetical protein
MMSFLSRRTCHLYGHPSGSQRNGSPKDFFRPAHVTDQLMLLIEGSLATGAARPGSRPARDARELAQRILG